MAHSSGRDAWGVDAGAAAAAAEKPSPGADPEKRRRILEAAIRTFGRRGFHEARIADIAADAKVAEGTVYLYFRNKEDLLGVVFDESMDDVLEKGRAVARADAPAPERLTALVDLHFQFIGSDRDLASVFQIELRRSARLVERFSRSKLVEHFRLLGDVLRDGIARGEFRRDLDPRLAVRILFGAADEILSEWLLSGDKKPSADAKQLVETLLRGFSEEEKRKTSLKVKKAAGRAGAPRAAAAPPRPGHSPFEERAEGAETVTRSNRIAARHRRDPK
jgi:TetR/AcrR family transcriptional regulator, fatty acid metabolism regulator protein